MRDKLVATLAGLTESLESIEKAYNAGVVEGFTKELDSQLLPPLASHVN